MSVETGYKPDEAEVVLAEGMMTEEQKEMSQRRESWNWSRDWFNRAAAQVSEYVSASPEERMELAIGMDDDVLKSIYGEGLPLKHIYHEFSSLTGQVAPHNFFTRPGVTLVSAVKSWNGTPEQISAAQTMVDLVEQNSARIRAKSPTLQRLLAPLESEDQIVSDEEIDFLAKVLGKDSFWIKDSKVGKERTRSAYWAAIEPSFGELFRRFAIQTETPEELGQYISEMNDVYERLADLAPMRYCQMTNL